MLLGGHNSEFCEQNFTDKSKHDKCILQRNLEKILQHSLKEQEKELGELELDESYFEMRCS